MEIKVEIGIISKLGNNGWVATADYPFDLTCSSYTQREAEALLHQQVAWKIRDLHESGELEKWLIANQIPFVKAERITHTIAHFQLIVSLA